MTIKEKGYTHWDGELEERKLPWWPITRQGIKLTFKKKFFKFTFLVSFIPALVYLIGTYISERIEDFPFLQTEQVDFLNINPGYFEAYLTNSSLLFIMVIILMFCGSSLISDDLKYNAMQLYFSRPLRVIDYFAGKISIILFFMLIFTLVPALVILLMKLIFSGSFKFFIDYPWLILSITGYSIVAGLFFSLYALFLSSLSKNRRYAGILIFAVYIFSDIVFGIFHRIFNSEYFVLFSIKSNLKQLGEYLFKQKLSYDVPWYLSFLSILAICGLAVIVLRKKVRGVEIAK